MSDLPTLLVNDADGVRTPTLNRGARRNAIDTALGTAVLAALRDTKHLFATVAGLPLPDALRAARASARAREASLTPPPDVHP